MNPLPTIECYNQVDAFFHLAGWFIMHFNDIPKTISMYYGINETILFN